MTLELGTYMARAVSGALGTAENGTEQIGIALEITSEGANQGQQIAWYGYFTDKTAERTMKILRKMGWSTDDLTDLTGIDANEVQIQIKEEEYQGKTRIKVDIFANDGPVLKNQMTPEQARAFAAQMKGAAVLSRGGRATAQPRPAARPRTAPPADQSPEAQRADDSDLPF